MKLSVPILQLLSLAVAVVLVKFPEPDYTFHDTCVPAGEIHHFVSVSSLSVHGTLDINSELRVHTGLTATINVKELKTHERAWFLIDGSGDVFFRVNESLTVAQRSKFRVAAQGNLDVAIPGRLFDFVNESDLELRAKKRLTFSTTRNLVNSGTMRLSARGKGHFVVGTIYNTKELHVTSRSAHDSITFGNLANYGTVVFSVGVKLAAAFQAEGTILNFGLIRFSSMSRKKFLTQNDKIVNSGLMHFRGTSFIQKDDVRGDGCWTLSRTSSIVLDMRHEFDRSMSIVLDSTSNVCVSQFVSSDLPFDLHGVGERHEFLRSLKSIDRLKYDETTGFLTVFGDAQTYAVFSIGRGFDGAKFQIRGTRVIHKGVPPAPRPQLRNCWVFLGWSHKVLMLQNLYGE